MVWWRHLYTCNIFVTQGEFCLHENHSTMFTQRSCKSLALTFRPDILQNEISHYRTMLEATSVIKTYKTTLFLMLVYSGDTERCIRDLRSLSYQITTNYKKLSILENNILRKNHDKKVWTIKTNDPEKNIKSHE